MTPLPNLGRRKEGQTGSCVDQVAGAYQDQNGVTKDVLRLNQSG